LSRLMTRMSKINIFNRDEINDYVSELTKLNQNEGLLYT
jgi:hypothetical protein